MDNDFLRIFYVYHEVYSEESATHEIDPIVVANYLTQKNYILSREDILYLLKNDGCSFLVDSLRVYDPELRSYFKVSEETEFDIQLLFESGTRSLLFWGKLKTEDFSRRVDDLEEKLEDEIGKMKEEIKKLTSYSQILFNQLVKIHQKQSQEPEEIPFLTAEHSSSPFSTENMDIALMYADPLVKETKEGVKSLGDAVDYEGECHRIVEIFKKRNKRLNIYFEIATRSGLVNTLSLSPAILHIICHGEFDQERGKFYLCFEDEGKLARLYSEDLKKILLELNFKTRIIFVNACHSEEVAQVFYEAGAPCVIAIQSELKIEDVIAQKFSENLYLQLLEGKTIGEAFKNAKAAVNGKDAHTCCCAHKHKPNCLWYKYAKKNGFDEAHAEHSPICSECKFEESIKHRKNCDWAINFMQDILGEYDIYDDEKYPGDELNVCCCSPELTHNEAMKFKLLCSEKSRESQVLFHNREKGEASIKSNFSCVEQKYPMPRILGRNKELYEIYKHLSDKSSKRIVNLYGTESIGKFTLSKRAANYMYERGFFGDKICVISLEKTPSREHFRADLIKEVLGVGSWERFLEAIKYSKILFILGNCECAIENYKQEFMQDLAAIAKQTIYVKFLLITNKMVDFNIGEECVRMTDLEKIDAARLLLERASGQLKVADRNPAVLKDHPIFDAILLIPKMIFFVVQKLQNKSLEAITNEFFALKAQQKIGPSEESSSEGYTYMKMTLREIKKMNVEAYRLAVFMSMFPAGLAYHNLEELASQSKIPTNWTWILMSFLDPQRHKELKDVKTLDRSYFKPKNYIGLNIEQDKNSDEIYFKPSNFLSRGINEDFESDFVELAIKKLEYMKFISLNMIEKVKANSMYHEKLAEFSAISSYSIWKYYNDEQDENEAVAQQAPLVASDVKKRFSSQLENLLSCFDVATIKNILATEDYQTETDDLLEILDVLCLTVPTLFKIMNPEEYILKDSNIEHEIIKNIFKILEVFPNDSRACMIRIKLNLFLAALYMRTKDNYNIANLKIENASNLATGLADPAVKAEIAFAKALHFYRSPKKGLIQKESFNPTLFYKALKGKLNEAKDCLKPLLGDEKYAHLFGGGHEKTMDICGNERYAPLVAKLTLLVCKSVRRYDVSNIELEHMNNMKTSLIILKEFKMERLLMKANYMYACLKLDLERNKGREKANNDSLEDKKNLVRVKHVYLMKGALEISQKIKDKGYESRINNKSEEFNMEIRRAYFNVIILMRAAPLVEGKALVRSSSSLKNRERQIQYDAVSTGLPVRTVSSFKDELTDKIKRSGKILYTKFEILTKDKLRDCLADGCRILFLNCRVTEPNYLCVEGEYSKLEKIPYVEVREIFTTKPIQMFASSSENHRIQNEKLDLLILGNRNDRPLANLFVELEIPHIVTFEFILKDAEFSYQMIEEECVNRFTVLFFQELIAKKTVAQAFNKAYQDTFEYLSITYFDKKQDPLYAQKIIGKGPVLLPEGKSHDKPLFNSQDLSLEKGKGEDISCTRCPTNISRFCVPYTGRNQEIYSFMEKICENKGFFKITGNHGSGRTSFILQVAYYILTRNIFPNGVFYIPVKNLKYGKSLTDLLKEILGFDFQTDIRSLFAEKRMLLVFDDFDYFYNNSVEFPQFLVPLKDCPHITCILITTTRKSEEEKSQHRRHEIESILLSRNVEWKLRPLSVDDLGYMILSLIETPKNDFNSVTLKKVKEGDWIKRAHGNPAKLIQELREGRIQIGERVLKISPKYDALLDLDQVYLSLKKHNSSNGGSGIKRSLDLDVPEMPGMQNFKSISLHDRVHSTTAHQNQNQSSLSAKLAHGRTTKSPGRVALARNVKSNISSTLSSSSSSIPSIKIHEAPAGSAKKEKGLKKETKRRATTASTNNLSVESPYREETSSRASSSQYGSGEDDKALHSFVSNRDYDYLPSGQDEMQLHFTKNFGSRINEMSMGEDLNADFGMEEIQEEEHKEDQVVYESSPNKIFAALTQNEEILHEKIDISADDNESSNHKRLLQMTSYYNQNSAEDEEDLME